MRVTLGDERREMCVSLGDGRIRFESKLTIGKMRRGNSYRERVRGFGSRPSPPEKKTGLTQLKKRPSRRFISVSRDRFPRPSRQAARTYLNDSVKQLLCLATCFDNILAFCIRVIVRMVRPFAVVPLRERGRNR